MLIDGQVALPAPGQPTSHILKPPIARFPGTANTPAKAVLADIESRHWDRFASDVQLGAPFVRTRVQQLCSAVIVAIDGKFAASDWRAPGFSPLKAAVRERASLLLGKF